MRRLDLPADATPPAQHIAAKTLEQLRQFS
jgi:hypothetical protein